MVTLFVTVSHHYVFCQPLETKSTIISMWGQRNCLTFKEDPRPRKG
jgi:hypothetical protein